MDQIATLQMSSLNADKEENGGVPIAGRTRTAAAAASIAVTLAAIVVTLAALAAGAHAQTSSASGEELEFASLINQERASRGLGALSADEELLPVARRHASRMAEAGTIFHNQALTSEVNNWYVLGENVGRGPTVGLIHEGFMNSPTHRDEILFPDYRAHAVGVVLSQGYGWVTELFVLRERPVVASQHTTSPPPRKTRVVKPLPITRVDRPPTLEVPASLRFTLEAERATLSLAALALVLICIDGHLLRLGRTRGRA